MQEATMKEPEIVNGAPVLTFDELRDELRAIYTREISTIVGECMERVILPADKAALAMDAAQFTVFLMVIKTAAANGQTLDLRALMSAYWPIQKHIKQELPGMLMEAARSAQEQG